MKESLKERKNNKFFFEQSDLVLTEEQWEQIESLADHPGFVLLMQQFNVSIDKLVRQTVKINGREEKADHAIKLSVYLSIRDMFENNLKHARKMLSIKESKEAGIGVDNDTNS